MPETPAADDAAGLRAANVRLRELLAERDARIAALEEQLAGLGAQVEALAAQVKLNSRNSSKPPSSDGKASRGTHFAAANKALYEAMSSDSDFAAEMEEMIPGVTQAVSLGVRGAFSRETRRRSGPGITPLILE